MKKFDIFIEGKSVNLIILTRQLAKNSSWYSWLNDKENTNYTRQGYFPNTKKNQIKYFENNITDKKNLMRNHVNKERIQLGIVTKKGNKFVGVISLYNFHFIERSCSVSILIDKKAKLNNSLQVYKESQFLLIDHAFKKLNIRRIEAGASSKQLAELAKKLFGFEIEGVAREKEFINGKYTDMYYLGLLKSDWKD